MRVGAMIDALDDRACCMAVELGHIDSWVKGGLLIDCWVGGETWMTGTSGRSLLADVEPGREVRIGEDTRC